MQAQWHYEHDGQWIGPVSAEYLGALLSRGELRRDAPVRLANDFGQPHDSTTITADQAVSFGDAPPTSGPHLGELRGGTSPSRPAPHATASDEGLPSPLVRGTRFLRRSLDALTEESKAAGQLAAKHAERWKLEQTTLRAAYLLLGQSVRRENRYRAELARWHERLDELAAQISGLRQSPPPDREFPSLWDKARTASAHAAAAPRIEALSIRAKQLLRELGKAAFERHGAQAAPDAFVRPLRSALDHYDALTRDIDRLSRTPPGRLISPRRAAAQSIRAATLAGQFLSRHIPKLKLQGRSSAT